MTNDQPAALARAADIVAAARYVIALVGAGISVESGISPFRGPGGLWTRFGEPGNEQWQRFLEDPRAWWRQRMTGAEPPRAPPAGSGQAASTLRQAQGTAWERARPNPAHYALAELEAMGIMKHVVTQNIDNLHQEAGTQSITEIHGNRYKLRCIRCHRRFPRDAFELSTEAPPACPGCGGMVKSDTVMFGEPIPPDAIERAFAEAERADCILIIGTSAVVYPAANLPLIVCRHGGRLIEVNPLETPLSDLCEAVLRGPAGEVMPALVEAVRKQQATGNRQQGGV